MGSPWVKFGQKPFAYSCLTSIAGAESIQPSREKKELKDLESSAGIAPWRLAVARRVESPRVQGWIVALVLANAVILEL